jgi:uncharacterized phage-associated protein
MTQLTVDYFDAEKAGQLMFYFLHKAATSGNNVTKLRLTKCLYLAERASYQHFGEPMIGDQLVSTQHGPAPSEVMSILEGRSRAIPKDVFAGIVTVSRPSGHQFLSVAPDCVYRSADDLDRFSDAEIELIDQIWVESGNWPTGQLETDIHDSSPFPEWNWKDGDRSNWIELEDLLRIVGYPDVEIEPLIRKILSFRPQMAAGTRRLL